MIFTYVYIFFLSHCDYSSFTLREWWHVAWGATETVADEWSAFTWIPMEHPGRLTPLYVVEKPRNHDNCCSMAQDCCIQYFFLCACVCACACVYLLKDVIWSWTLFVDTQTCERNFLMSPLWLAAKFALWDLLAGQYPPPPRLPFSVSKHLSFSQYITYSHSFSSFFPPVTPLPMNLSWYLYLSFCKSSASARASPQVLLHGSSPRLLPRHSLIHSPSSTIHLSAFALKLCLFYSLCFFISLYFSWLHCPLLIPLPCLYLESLFRLRPSSWWEDFDTQT